MKKLLLAIVAFFAFSFAAFAAVDLNTATKEELDTVKGIGPVKAQAIVDYRKKNGPFKSVDDLKNVKGFGEKTVAKIRADLTVGGAPAKAETTPAKAEDRPAKADARKDEKAEKKNETKKGGKPEKKADIKKNDKADKKAEKKKEKAEKKKTKADKKEDKSAQK